MSQCFIIDDMEPLPQSSSSVNDAAIPPSHQALAEALALSGEILRNIELSELPLKNIALKVSRLARLLNEIPVQKVMEYEAGGYPTEPAGVPPEIWQSAVAAGRKFELPDPQTKQSKEYRVHPD